MPVDPPTKAGSNKTCETPARIPLESLEAAHRSPAPNSQAAGGKPPKCVAAFVEFPRGPRAAPTGTRQEDPMADSLIRGRPRYICQPARGKTGFDSYPSREESG